MSAVAKMNHAAMKADLIAAAITQLGLRPPTQRTVVAQAKALSSFFDEMPKKALASCSTCNAISDIKQPAGALAEPESHRGDSAEVGKP